MSEVAERVARATKPLPVMERWQSWVLIWIASPFVGAAIGSIILQ